MQNEDTTPDWIYSNIKDAAGQAEKVYFIYLGAILFVLISLSIIPDKALYLINSNLKLPVIQSEVPTEIFVWFAPLLLVFIYIGLQVALYKVHELHQKVEFIPKEERENRVFPFSLYNSLVYPESGIFGTIQTLFAELTTFYSIVFVCLTAFYVTLKGREWIKESLVFAITCFAFILATYYQRRFREISNSQDNNKYTNQINAFIWGILSFCPWFIWLLAQPNFISGLPLVWSMLAITFFTAYLGNFICLLAQSQRRKILKRKLRIILNNKYLKLSFATLLISSVYAFVFIDWGARSYPLLDSLERIIDGFEKNLPFINILLLLFKTLITLIVIILIWYLISFIFVKLFIYWYKKDELHPDSERWQIIQKNAKADKKVFWYFALYATVAESLRIILKFNQAEYDPYKTCYFFCQLALLALIVCQFYKFIKPDNKQVKPFSKFTIFALIALGSILYSWFFLSFLIFICLWGFRRIAKSARLAYAKRNWKVDFLHCLELLPRLNKWTTFILLFSYTVFFIPLKSLGISLIGITTPIILVKLLILVILGLCFLKLVFEPIIKIKNIFSFELNRIFGNQGNSQLEKSSLICFGISLFACFVSFWTIADMSIYPINLRIENINQTQDKDNHNELRNERDLYLPWKAANKISNVKIIGKTNEALILDKSTIHNLDLSKLEIEEIPKNLFIIKAMDEFFVSYMKIWQDLLNNTGQWPSGDSWEDKFFQVDIKEMETQKEKFNTYTPAISLRGATISGTIKFPSNVKVGLTNADLTNADLTEANLENADLTEANLENADLTEAILPRQVDWVQKIKNKSLVKVNLTKTDLTKTDLTNAELTNAELENAKLTNTKLKDSILINANLKGTESSGILVCGLVVDQLCEAISIWNTKLDKDLLKEVKEKPACKNKLQFPSKELIEDADIKLEEIIENEDLSDADLNGSEWISDKSIFCKASKFPAKEKIPKEVLEVIQNKCPDKLTK